MALREDEIVELPDTRYFPGIKALGVSYEWQQVIRMRAMDDRAKTAVHRWFTGKRGWLLGVVGGMVALSTITGINLSDIGNFIAQHGSVH